MQYPCQIKKQEKQPVLSIRTHAAVQDLPQLIGTSYGRIIQYMETLGEKPAGVPFVAYYNLDMQNLDLEIGFPTSRTLQGKEEIQPNTIADGMIGFCEYTGEYQKMEPAYAELTAFIQKKGYDPTGVVYEYYLNSPDEVPMDQLKTWIVFPLK